MICSLNTKNSLAEELPGQGEAGASNPSQSVVKNAPQPIEKSPVTTVVQNGRTLTIKPFEFRKINLNGNLS